MEVTNLARITLGIGTSHGPMLSVKPESWPERVKADRLNPRHFFRGKTYSFDELVELRKNENLSKEITLPIFRERHARCRAAIARLADVFEANKPEVAIVVGNDQMEVFTKDHVPAFAVFWGHYVEGIPRTPEFLATLPPGIAEAELDRTPSEYTRYPTLPALGRHIIEQGSKQGFDLAQLTRLTTGEIGSNSVPHAWGFVYRRIMRDKVVPHVPIFVNTFYPPNQPGAVRCFEFGRLVARAVASWPSEQTVAVIASGGLTHWVIDEAFDHTVIEALKNGDDGVLSGVSEDMFQAGTSEIKNWITVAGILSETRLGMQVVDYVPCYRSEAGTGNAMAFAYWQ
jgi:3-O-methylgallate 3,4-dioxygenase